MDLAVLHGRSHVDQLDRAAPRCRNASSSLGVIVATLTSSSLRFKSGTRSSLAELRLAALPRVMPSGCIFHFPSPAPCYNIHRVP